MLWLLFLIVTAYQNQGYWHPDEHFQILEFANFKAGLTPESMLPWEFAAKIRPWTLPAATLVVLQTLRGLHIYSPVTQTFVLRLLTVLGALASSLYFLRALRLSDYISERQESYARHLLAVLWFVPILWVRHTSESWSSICFYAGVALQLEGRRLSQIRFSLPLATLLFALSFHCRFQAGFLVLGFGLWLLFQARERISVLVLQSGLFCLFFGGLCLLDWWGYGTATLTPWNYFRVNIIGDVASHYGTSPLWELLGFWVLAFPPVSLVLLAATLWYLMTQRRQPLTWAIWPFLLVHCVIAHKELRFFVSIYWMLPLLLAVFWDGVLSKSQWARQLRTPFVLLNLPVGLTLALLPQNRDVAFLGQVWNRVEQRHAAVELWDGAYSRVTNHLESPFVQADLPTAFYDHPSAHRTELARDTTLAEELQRARYQPHIFVVASPQYHPELVKAARRLCRQTLSSYGEWLWTPLFARLGSRVPIRQWYLFEDCRPDQLSPVPNLPVESTGS